MTTPATSSVVAKRPAGMLRLYSACGVIGQGRRHVGLDEARRDDVRGDAAAAQLARERPGEADERALGCGVVDLTRRAVEPDHARDQDDAPPLGAQHPLRRALDDAERAAEVRRDDAVEVVLGHAQQQRVLRDAGIGDDDLDRTQLLLDLGERGVDGSGIRHIGADGERAFRALTRAGGHGDLVALRDEALGDGTADAAVASCDQDDAIGGHGALPGAGRDEPHQPIGAMFDTPRPHWDADTGLDERPSRERQRILTARLRSRRPPSPHRRRRPHTRRPVALPQPAPAPYAIRRRRPPNRHRPPTAAAPAYGSQRRPRTAPRPPTARPYGGYAPAEDQHARDRVAGLLARRPADHPVHRLGRRNHHRSHVPRADQADRRAGPRMGLPARSWGASASAFVVLGMIVFFAFLPAADRGCQHRHLTGPIGPLPA